MWALPNFPMVEPGDDLAAMIVESANAAGIIVEDGDLLVIAQKIVSKAENRYVYLNKVDVSDEANRLAAEVGKDPRLVQLILSESKEVVRKRTGVLVVEHRCGYVHANAGIDRSNITSDAKDPRVLLLPENPDQSAARLRLTLRERTGVTLAVIINDSSGRAWRMGTTGIAIGCAGIIPLMDLVGQKDLFGRRLEVTQVAVADELAAAASFLMGQADEATPVILIRGAPYQRSEKGSGSLIRPKGDDLFR
jgi:coenzyme F420-0:L-glutamate ligase/coenzyme F420-1:gamma-L-glutamate ligase